MSTDTKRTHLFYLTVSEDVRREIRFAERGECVEVYAFDGENLGTELTRSLSREEARIIWTLAIAEGYVWTRSMVELPPAPQTAVEIAPAPVTKPAAPSFESETCSRCGGSGHFSRCASYGTTCFKCAGKGVTLTKRGAAAMAYLRILRSKRTDALVPGDVVQHPGFEYMPTSWETMTAESIALRIACGWSPESMVRVRQTREQSRSTFAAALAYQATLTKSGTVRKVTRAAQAQAA